MIYISITPALYWWVYKLGPGMSHITIHCSHATTMPRKGSSSSTWKKFKTKQKKRASLQKRLNQRCIGCLRKSCPKKFNNNNEDKCGKFINFLLFKYYIEYASSKNMSYMKQYEHFVFSRVIIKLIFVLFISL